MISPKKSNGTSLNIWQQMLRDCSVRSKLPVVNLLVVGDPESGKRELISHFNIHESTIQFNEIREKNILKQESNYVNGLHSIFTYKTIDVIDPTAIPDLESDITEDVIAQLKTWVLNKIKLQDLMRIALQPSSLDNTVVVLVLDLSRPWLIKSSLENWTSIVQGQMLGQFNTLLPDKQAELYTKVMEHIKNYKDPMINVSSATANISISQTFENEIPESTKNLGVPFIIAIAKSDLRPETSVRMDYIEHTIRLFALKYGAAVVYTSAKSGTNVSELRDYILHRAFPDQFKWENTPQVVDKNAIFIPSGFDTTTLINESLLGSQPQWPPDITFEKMVPNPVASEELTQIGELSMAASYRRVDTHDAWLEKLQKAAGAGLDELQKQGVEASKKAEAAATARRAAAERRRLEEKDVSSTHLANFFNNLLSRPEKSKSARTLTNTSAVSGSDKKS